MSKRQTDTDSHKEAQRLQRISMALEELVWSLRGQRLELLEEASSLVRNLATDTTSKSTIARGYRSEDPNKHFLIGVLPRLFQDKELFPQNDDIVEFASSALGLLMNRSEKRSRYEIIGKVICETDLLDEYRLTDLVSALEKLIGNKDHLAQMIEKKRSGSFSWNETIQNLLKS